MNNSIQATSCKASAENFFRAEIYRTCTTCFGRWVQHRGRVEWSFDAFGEPSGAMGAARAAINGTI